MELYTYYRSTASYRVRIALALKGLDFTALPVNLLVPAGGANRQPDYLAINPQGRVPALRSDEGALLIQSQAIIEYLEECYPQVPLLAKDLVARAHERAVASIIALATRLGEQGAGLRGFFTVLAGDLGLAWATVLFDLALVSLDLPAVAAIAVFPAALVLWPGARWAGAINMRKAGAVALGLSISAALIAHFVSPWSVRYPRPSSILHVTEGLTGQSWRVGLSPLDAWTEAALRADGGTVTRRSFPSLFMRDRPAAKAQPIEPAPPAISFSHDVDGRLVLRTLPVSGGDRLMLQIKVDAPIEGAQVSGRRAPVLSEPGEWTTILWQASEKGVAVSFHPRGLGTISVRYASLSRSWPVDARPLPALPADRMTPGLGGASAVVAEKSYRW